VFLHGLTFDRRMWKPIVERLGGSVRSVLVDLPAHGESAGNPAPLDEVAASVHELVASLDIDRPILVGHSMSVGIAFFYAFAYDVAGVVAVDQGMDIRPFAQLVQRLEAQLRGDEFPEVWQVFEQSLGLDQLPEPQRALAAATHRVQQDVVVGYWDMLMRADPDEFQASLDARIQTLDMPCLAVFGRELTGPERERFELAGDCQIEEWSGSGHCVHLYDPDRFATTLRMFIERCTTGPGSIASAEAN
jgi:pimeloyl-ACP methyl ester carboxylesterase